MKRSEINKLISEAIIFFKTSKFYLPPWAYWSPQTWEKNRHRAVEVIENKLGWDLTDFGLGKFYETGLLLFTVRNGKVGDTNGKDYAEKIMIVREKQVTPWHFHRHKMEDIINRGGGNLIIDLCNSTENEKLADTDVTIQTDSITRTVPAKGSVTLTPGESITLPPFLYHQFYGEKDRGWVLVGEVSRVNDDDKDNRFLETIGRFPQIEQDEPPLYYLCNEYPA